MMLAFLLLLAPPVVDADVVYSRVDGFELKMDIYRPILSREKLPAVVVIHGGAWMMGKKEDMAAMARYAAEKGVVAASVQYRLAPTSKWPAMLDDVQTAVRYLRANADKYNLDPKRIGAAGASAGGHLALFLGARDTRKTEGAEYPNQSSRVSAVLDVFGPVDMNLYPQLIQEMMSQQIVGKKFTEAADALKDASPIHFIDRRSAPVFIIQGTADLVVPSMHSKALEQKYKDLGLPVTTRYIDGMAHELPLAKPEVRSAFEAGVHWLLTELRK